ncbi:class I SAM-dependent methyltransferase [Motilimonas sp. E26]|uniref:class I SAM-dependent methyltransferase n=1 Tax=Motilimonas sp. E26 TaxID=2865674 RepID=UPI001E42781C|nr:class I SAM-dependent methyltransferase [Motilimonas sp. E26]MCE0555467.1 methyltransferase domain-containing protein [Motilimonas sp. E26]
MSVDFYNQHAEQLAQVYLSKTFEQVHQPWLTHLTPVLNKANARILDLGAGAGRDSKYLAQQGAANGVQITAIEPALTLAELGKQHTLGLNVNWLQDSLPDLHAVTKQEISFDLILLSAVWMHIPQSQRERSLRKLANLLKPGGKLVISLRHGPSGDARNMFDVCSDQLTQLATRFGLTTLLVTDKGQDVIGRESVAWQTVVLQLPDDGTGAFPFIRHVALNDGKSATHKLALMRVLLRIADGHPGAVLRREDNRVILPMGLVALYWAHQYKDLIDKHQLFQRPGHNPNMGFMKQDGWHKLTHLQSSDYRIGNLFTGATAIAMHKVLSASASNIKTMPCRFITYPNSDEGVFEVNSKSVRATDSLFLDLTTLNQWGEFSLPEHLWLAFSRYACWIEPVLISEWVKTMASYAGNQAYHTPAQQYVLYNALNWLETKRNTSEVRSRFDALKQSQGNTHNCVWTNKSLKHQYAIDHCMPFARWPNNDLWNLLPTDVKANGEKSDRLPTEPKMKAAKLRITHWWRDAWLDGNDIASQQRFFAEANIALPGLNANNSSVDDLFEALLLQRGRLREMQQLREW